MSKVIRIVIADDHPIFRHGLRTMIEADPRLKVVAEADDGESALARIEELQPDVVVLDIDMPPPDGLAVARRLHEQRSAVAAIFLTMHKEEALLDAALEVGVQGFVVKDGAASEIVGCIKAVAAGQSFFSPALSGYLLARRNRADSLAGRSTSINDLTASERRVLLLIGEAKTNQQVAGELFISVRTVEHHRANICAKLGLTGKNALLTFALTHKTEL
ncbi:MAG TPA: response regulator transcription factor [Pyrinomonadaceae bacterium]